jgi:hypothetical protein
LKDLHPLGLAQYAQGRATEAVGHFQAVLADAPGHPSFGPEGSEK